MLRTSIVTIAAAALTGCARPDVATAPPPRLGYALDSARSLQLRDGVTHHFLHSATGPWAIHVLDIDLRGCNRLVALKGAQGAIGRSTTSAILTALDRSADVIGGVNADFFLFAPPGVPVGAMITSGRVITGPSRFPVFAIDSSGRPQLATLRVDGTVKVGAASVPVTGWNRVVPDGVAYIDRNWNRSTDTASGALEVGVDASGRVTRVDTATAGVEIPGGGGVLVVGRNAPPAVRAALGKLTSADTIRVAVGLAPVHPMEAVGGRPILVRDSASVVDTDTSAFALARHPRTAVGLSKHRERLWLVVVDGRQKPYSDGMSLRELAALMRSLGAHDAINLDGGGSSAMIIADPTSHALRVVNRPSDATGERPVGNALGLIRQCTPTP